MGKEIRAGLSVVGALLIGFCVLLYARLSRGPGGLPDASIQTDVQQVRSSKTTRQQVRGTPTIVKDGDPYESSSDSGIDSPWQSQQDESQLPDDLEDRERLFLPIAPGPLGDGFVSTGRGAPDAVAPSATMSVTVQSGENLQRLAHRIFGSAEYDRALWQWLFDRDQVESVQPGATLELPTKATLKRNYPQLLTPE